MSATAWAETVVHAKGNSYPPRDGDACGRGCGCVLREGDRAFRLTESGDAWVCETCAGEGDQR